MAKQKALIVCPGRGTYNKTELGYLGRFHADKAAFLDMVDAHRESRGQTTVRALDAASAYSLATHTRGDNASPLIFACSYADFLSIDRAKIDIVAATGNSMGWYTTLACGGALTPEHALWVVNAMGVAMQEALIGGQVIHIFVDDDWRVMPGRREELLALVEALHGQGGRELYVSIALGGMLLVAGNDAGLDAFMSQAPVGPGRFPMRLQNHAAFHAPLQAPISAQAKATLAANWFRAPEIPLIDGRGHIWRPHVTDTRALWDYTLGAQVVEPYDFTTAVQVGVREFAPDCLIVLGPGDTLGGAVAQSLIAIDWRGLDSKSAFVSRQADAPFVIAMGRDEQRGLAVA